MHSVENSVYVSRTAGCLLVPVSVLYEEHSNVLGGVEDLESALLFPSVSVYVGESLRR